MLSDLWWNAVGHAFGLFGGMLLGMLSDFWWNAFGHAFDFLMEWFWACFRIFGGMLADDHFDHLTVF